MQFYDRFPSPSEFLMTTSSPPDRILSCESFRLSDTGEVLVATTVLRPDIGPITFVTSAVPPTFFRTNPPRLPWSVG